MCDISAPAPVQVINVVLDGLNNILKWAEDVEAVARLIEECGGLDRIEALQNHEHPDIYQLAFDIIDHYFSDEPAGVSAAAASRGRSVGLFSAS